MRRQSASFALIAFAPLLAAPAESSTATFTGVGDLPGGGFHSIAMGLSADGSTVVGRSTSASGPEAFRWVNGSTIEGLGDLAGGAFDSEAAAASADGSVVVGTSDGDEPPTSRAFRWTEASGMEAVPDFWIGAALWHVAQDVTADGSIVAGWNYLDFFGSLVGFNGWLIQGNSLVWDLETLTPTPDGQVLSPEVRAISADGSVWAGMAIFDPNPNREGVVWTDGGSVVTFIDKGAGAELHGLSADGVTAVGEVGGEAYAWTAAGGVVQLGDLAGGSFASSAFDASADGSVVVGYGTTDLGTEAFVWDAANGMRHLGDLLECRGAPATGWTKLSQAVAISDDASTIAGFGINPQGDTEAWTATVPFLAVPCGLAVPTTSDGGVAILIVLMLAVARASRSGPRRNR